MLLVTLGLLLGAAALLWCVVLALTLGDGDTREGEGFDARLFPASVKDQPTGRLALHRIRMDQDFKPMSDVA
jgi:hypothetical protein